MGSVFMYDHITGRRKVLTASEIVVEKRLRERRRDIRSAIRGEQLRLFRSDRTTERAGGGDGGASGGSAAVFEFLLEKLDELDTDDLEHLVKVATDAQGVLQPDRLDPADLKRFRGEVVPRARPGSPGGAVESYWPSERTEKATEKWVENQKIWRVQDNLINGVLPKERDIKAVRARGGGVGEGGGGGWDLAEMKRRGRGIRGLDTGPSLPPASLLRLYGGMESHELLITVEYCHHCSWHNFSLRHDPKQYSAQADKILAYMVQLCHREGVCAKVGVGRFMSRCDSLYDQRSPFMTIVLTHISLALSFIFLVFP